MFFLQATQAPIPVTIGRDTYNIPRFIGQDFVDWAAELKSERLQEITQQLEGPQLAEFLTLYPPSEPDFGELRRLARTPSGAARIIRICMNKPGVTSKSGTPPLSGEKIEEILKQTAAPRLEQLASLLAGLGERLEKPIPSEEPNPLSGGGKAGSKPSPATGESSSPTGLLSMETSTH